MTTSRIPTEYYTSEEYFYPNQKTSPRKIYSHPIPSDEGVVVSKHRSGTYNIVEKDFGEHKVVYHIPIEYGDNFDVTQLEDIPIFEEQQVKQRNSPQLIRRRIIQQYKNYEYDDDDDDENNIEYIEEVPATTSRRHIVGPSKRSPRKTVEYIYEDDQSDPYEDQTDDQIEQVEYIVRERKPKQTYKEKPRSTRRTVYVEESPVPASTSSPSPPPPPQPLPPPPPAIPPAAVSRSPHRSSHENSLRPAVNYKSVSSTAQKSSRRSDVSPPASSRRAPTNRSSPIHEPLIKPNIPKSTEPPLRLMDVIAQNRAKRGGRIPKPKREVDEEKPYDPPTYHRNIIKNGFIVHK